MNNPLKNKSAVGISPVSRRKFLNLSSRALIGGTIVANMHRIWAAHSPRDIETPTMPHPTHTFEVEPLSYPYNALEPIIDTETMHLHHDKHYVTYTKNLNEALSQLTELQSSSIIELLSHISHLPPSVQNTIRNNGGGFYNHGLFWKWMTPYEKGQPSDLLQGAINKTFGSFTNMQEKFIKEAASIFGSGWAWLIVHKDRGLEITFTSNQDNPLMKGIVKSSGHPILGLDVWEHAYYLKYKNERAKYIAAWWNLIDWKTVNSLFAAATV